MVNRTEKHRTDKRKRNIMTVQAFCACTLPYECDRYCGIDENTLYIRLEGFLQEAYGMHG